MLPSDKKKKFVSLTSDKGKKGPSIDVQARKGLKERELRGEKKLKPIRKQKRIIMKIGRGRRLPTSLQKGRLADLGRTIGKGKCEVNSMGQNQMRLNAGTIQRKKKSKAATLAKKSEGYLI